MNQTTTLKSYADVQSALNVFVTAAGVSPSGAPHRVFWNTLTYEQFISGAVPGVTDPGSGQPYKILVVGDSKNSTIIQILSGIGVAAGNFGQMPQPSPPYTGQQALITALSQWIDAGCPNGARVSAVAPHATTAGFDLYRVDGFAGNAGTPGAPILHFALLVHASTGKVSGQVQITQAVAPPDGSTHVNVTGQLRQLGFGQGPVTQLVSLEGTYPYSLPPPAIGSVIEQFSASFATDKQWNGRGSFSWGGREASDIPVHSRT